jgi:thioredoxin 1
MTRTVVVVISIAVFFLFGGLILVWSAHQQKADTGAQPSGFVKKFTDENFQAEVLEISKTKPVLVDFYAEWCHPCRMLDKTLDELAREVQGKAVVGKIDYDKNFIKSKFQVNRIPAVFIIREGEIRHAWYGVVPKETLKKALEE